jgi:hypothetical protein
MINVVELLNSIERCRFGQRLPTAAIAETTLVTGSISFYYPSSLGETRRVAAGLLREFGQRPPVVRDDRLGRRHRDLGSAPGYERGKGDADRYSVTIEDSTREQQPERVSGALRSARDPGIGRVETEMVRALDDVCLFSEPPGQDYEISSTATDGDATSQTSSGLRGQCRRDEEAPPFQVEEWIHALRIYASRRTAIDGVRDYCSALYLRMVPRVEERERRA